MMERLRPLFCIVIALMMPFAGASARQTPAAGGPTDPQKLWAFVIGISNYAHAVPLQYAASDAQLFREFLESSRGGGIPGDHIYMFLEETATRTSIVDRLDEFQDKVKAGDTVYVYVAGHGVTRKGTGYYVPSDGDVNTPQSTCVGFDQLKSMIQNGLSQSRVRVFVSDICFSGRINPNSTPTQEAIQNLINADLINFNPGGNTFLNFFASGPNERSWEREDLEQGVFTYALLQALNGKAVNAGENVVAARNAVDYVKTEVPKFTANGQHPVVNQNFDGSLPLAFLDRPGPMARVRMPVSTLVFLNIERSMFSRVEWTDPKTMSKAIKELPKDAMVKISSLPPGELNMRFFDMDNKDRSVPVKLSPGENRLDLVTMNISRGPAPAPVVQTAGLTPIVVGPPVQQQAAPDSDADLLVRADAQTTLFVDGALWGNGDAGNRYVTLTGLSPGTHNVTIIPNPQREYRFRLKLFRGSQILDVGTGEVRYIADVQPPPVLAPPPGVPAAQQNAYNNFTQAMWEERLVEPTGNSAWDYFQQMRDALPVPIRNDVQHRLTIAMGDRAQRTILKYVRGHDIRWNAAAFDEGAVLMDHVRQTFKTTPDFESRQSFFAGRAQIERGQYADAIPQLQQSTTLDPAASHSYNAIGLAFWKQNLLAQAIPPLQQAIDLSPDWLYPRITLALIYLEQRRYSDSEQAFQQALQIDAESSTAENGLGQLYLVLSRYDESEQRLQKAIEFNPGNAYAYHNYGRLYRRRDRLADAERMYRTAILLEPDEPAFQLSLGEIQKQQGRLNDAQTSFAKVANQADSNLQVLQSYTTFLVDQKKNSDAQKIFDQAMKKLPKDANVRVLYGAFLRKIGKASDAEKQYKSAISMASANTFAHTELASLYLEQKKTGDAERELTLASQADPLFGAPEMLLGKVRAAQKRYEEALAQFRKALEVSIEPAQQQELKELIASVEPEVAAGRAANAKNWNDYVASLKVTPDSPKIKSDMIAFQLEHPVEADTSSLPPSDFSAALNSTFWKEQLQAETLWRSGQKDAAAKQFSNSLEKLAGPEKRLVTSTAFNDKNDAGGIHQIVYRWALRLIEGKEYREALALMELSVRQFIFGIEPNSSPLVIDSLMWPPDVADPKEIKDYDVQHRKDQRAHEIYAAAHAGLGDSQASLRYLAALEELGAPYYILLSQIQCQTGNCAAGKQTLQQAQKKFPKDKSIEDAVRRLK